MITVEEAKARLCDTYTIQETMEEERNRERQKARQHVFQAIRIVHYTCCFAANNKRWVCCMRAVRVETRDDTSAADVAGAVLTAAEAGRMGCGVYTVRFSSLLCTVAACGVAVAALCCPQLGRIDGVTTRASISSTGRGCDAMELLSVDGATERRDDGSQAADEDEDDALSGRVADMTADCALACCVGVGVAVCFCVVGCMIFMFPSMITSLACNCASV